MFYPKEGEFQKNISVKKTWLKQWYKHIFHSKIKRNKQNKYTLKDLKDLHLDFKERLNDWKNHSEEIKPSQSQEDSKISRRSDIAENIKALSSRKLMIYIQDFLKESHTTFANLDEKMKNLKENLETLQEQLKSAIQDYLPSQSSGIEIAKASLNYYTLNKKQKEYYEDETQKTWDKVYKNHFSIIRCSEKKETYYWNLNDNNFNQYSNNLNERQKKNQGTLMFQFTSQQEKEWLKRYHGKHKDKFEGNFRRRVVFIFRSNLSYDESF